MKTVILVTREGLGQVQAADHEFGVEMFDRFVHALEGEERRPEALCFYTDGVKLLVEGSRALPGLRLLAGLGVRLVACRSCLEKFGLLDRLGVGEVGTMKDVVRLIQDADKVVTI
jgi:intracellular sulfur oxidation DsrE/DsrF family protein